MSNFYDDVLREIVAALGAALFVGNLMAYIKSRQLERAGGVRQGATEGDLPVAPRVRTMVYMAIGFFVMVSGLASMAVL